MFIHSQVIFFFFFNDTATTEIYTLSLHDALPISVVRPPATSRRVLWRRGPAEGAARGAAGRFPSRDRKSTRLNSSHVEISYAVFCLKKKKFRNKIIKYPIFKIVIILSILLILITR